MPAFQTAAAAALGFLAVSSGAHARTVLDDSKGGATKSSAKCTVVALGYSEVSAKEAIASTVADASAYICGEGVSAKSEIDIATDTAEVFALAVASAAASCVLTGDSKAHVSAKADAKAAAEVFVATYAEAWAGAGDCDKCDAFADSFGYIEKYVFLEAVAKAGFKLDALSTAGGAQVSFTVIDFKAELEKIIVESFSAALAGAASFKKSDGCIAWVNTAGCIYKESEPENADCHVCTAVAVSSGAIEEIDALAEASASASAFTCLDREAVIDDAYDSAKKTAKAFAIALSYAFAECFVEGEGFACAVAGTTIEEIAHATATAKATIWADAIICKDTCKVEVDSYVEATSSILAKAGTEAYAAICSNGGYYSEEAFALAISEASIEAVAKAEVSAISLPPYTCVAGGTAEAKTH